MTELQQLVNVLEMIQTSERQTLEAMKLLVDRVRALERQVQRLEENALMGRLN